MLYASGDGKDGRGSASFNTSSNKITATTIITISVPVRGSQSCQSEQATERKRERDNLPLKHGALRVPHGGPGPVTAGHCVLKEVHKTAPLMNTADTLAHLHRKEGRAAASAFIATQYH